VGLDSEGTYRVGTGVGVGEGSCLGEIASIEGISAPEYV